MTIHSDNPASQPHIYHIRLQGHLHQRWSEWFADMRIVLDETGETVLIGPISDQAVLYGLLRKIRDLGLPLIALMRIEDQ